MSLKSKFTSAVISMFTLLIIVTVAFGWSILYKNVSNNVQSKNIGILNSIESMIDIQELERIVSERNSEDSYYLLLENQFEEIKLKNDLAYLYSIVYDTDQNSLVYGVFSPENGNRNDNIFW